MKILKMISISLLIASCSSSAFAVTNKNNFVSMYVETPAKMICLKNSAASNVDEFFKSTTIFNFEIYKPGTKEELAKIISFLKKESGVETCITSSVAGDYQGVTLVLKNVKNKAWFISAFKKAGLNTIKINNNPIVEIEKM